MTVAMPKTIMMPVALALILFITPETLLFNDRADMVTTPGRMLKGSLGRDRDDPGSKLVGYFVRFECQHSVLQIAGH